MIWAEKLIKFIFQSDAKLINVNLNVINSPHHKLTRLGKPPHKKVLFLVVRTTKRGGGVRARPLRKKELF